MNKGRLYTILIHIAGWLLFFSLPVVFIASRSAGNEGRLFSTNPWNILSFVIFIAIFYLNTYLLFPRLYFQRKKFLYFSALLILLIAVFFLKPFDRLANQNRFQEKNGQAYQRPPAFMNERPLPPPNGNRPPPPGIRASFNRPQEMHIDIVSIALFIVVVVISLAVILEQRWRIAVQDTARAEADKANAELSFLKAQINPHFLFNTLNNIYSLAVTKNEHVADAIMKLSNLMRYVTDDVNEDYVSLEKELESITDYISLQRLRLGKKVTINFSIEGNTNEKNIAPLILMPFVENAFKHGISSAEASDIVIKLTATADRIDFYTTNRLFDTPRSTERTGIGSTNTKKRLNQLYPRKHDLTILAENARYTVHLVMYI